MKGFKRIGEKMLGKEQNGRQFVVSTKGNCSYGRPAKEFHTSNEHVYSQEMVWVLTVSRQKFTFVK